MTTIEDSIRALPLEIQNIIFYYIPTSGTAEIIQYAIGIYKIDRKYTKRFNLYFIHPILTFAEYMCDNPIDYEYGPPTTYNTPAIRNHANL
jgi:hypothetical protein